MAKIQCKMCGGELDLPENISSGECQYCGTKITFPKVSDEHLENLYNRAEHFRRINDYSKAVHAYDKYITANPEDSEAYWGLVLSRFGIEYVEDPVSHERIPTCHRVSYDSILSDPDYLSALENAGHAEREIYEHEAKRIAEIQKGILAISSHEEPFDIFICYKESDKFGRRTKDSVVAQDIYYALTNAGYKVFFSRITLESKVGQQYEPYIFAALNSAKVMLVIGSEKDYFDAVWVRNEWSRFLELMKKDRKRLLIPCYRDMDAYDIPDELSMFQAQDMSKIGFVQDLLRGIQKVCSRKEEEKTVEPPQAASTDPSSAALLRRAQLFIKVGDFNSAKEYCERVLDADPENQEAYLCQLMAEVGIKDESQLDNVKDLESLQSFQLLRQVATGSLKEKIDNIEAKNSTLKKIKSDSINRTGALKDFYENERRCYPEASESYEIRQELEQCIKNELKLQADPQIWNRKEIIARSETILAKCKSRDYFIMIEPYVDKRKTYYGAYLAFFVVSLILCSLIPESVYEWWMGALYWLVMLSVLYIVVKKVEEF